MQDVKSQQNVQELNQKDVKPVTSVFQVKRASETLVKSVLQVQDLKSKFDKQSVTLLSKCIETAVKLNDDKKNRTLAEQVSNRPFSSGVSEYGKNTTGFPADDDDFFEIPDSPEHNAVAGNNGTQHLGHHEPSIKNIFYSAAESESKPSTSESLVNRPLHKTTTVHGVTLNGFKPNVFSSSNNNNRNKGNIVAKPPSSLIHNKLSSNSNSTKHSQQPAITKFMKFGSADNSKNNNRFENSEKLSTVQVDGVSSVLRNNDDKEQASGEHTVPSHTGSGSVFQPKLPSKQLVELMKSTAYCAFLLNKGALIPHSLLKAGEEVHGNESLSDKRMYAVVEIMINIMKVNKVKPDKELMTGITAKGGKL